MICLSETHLECTVASDDKNLEIRDYNLVRSDHLANIRVEDSAYTIKLVCL